VKVALVAAGGGFIGSHLARRLKAEGTWVRAVDLHPPRYAPTAADEFIVGDLRDPAVCAAALAGGHRRGLPTRRGHGRRRVHLHRRARRRHHAQLRPDQPERAAACASIGIGRIVYASSACIYPESNQLDPDHRDCSEGSAYPAAPDSEYGWEKLFSERLYQAYARNYGIAVRIARFHNIFGPEGSWNDGREKVPAALCRKVAMAPPGGEIEIRGDGAQARSFLYVDACLDGVLRLMRSDCAEPLNIGSEEMLTIDQLACTIMDIAGKRVTIRHIDGPLGVRGRTSVNRLISERLGWAPRHPVREGLVPTYRWIDAQVRAAMPDRDGA
jgi:nucleoside-diphosphate-sugar epimerase